MVKAAADSKLQRVGNEPAPWLILGDPAVAAYSPHLVGGYGRTAGKRTRKRRVLILRQESGSEIYCIDVGVVEQIVRVLTVIGYVDQLLAQHHLDAAAPSPGAGVPAVKLVDIQIRSPLGEKPTHRLQLGVIQGLICQLGRILHLGVDAVPGGTIKKETTAAPEDKPPVGIKCHSKTRLRAKRRPIVSSGGHGALSRTEQAVERISRTRHQRADSHCCVWSQQFTGTWVFCLTIRAGAGRSRTTGHVEERRTG